MSWYWSCFILFNMGNNCSCWFCVDIYLMMTHNRLSEIFGLQILLIFMFILCWCLFLFWFNVRKRVIWGKDEEIFVSQMSRYLFPLLFALFNIFYWSHYLNQVFTLSIVYFPQKWVHLFKNWNYPRAKKDALFGVWLWRKLSFLNLLCIHFSNSRHRRSLTYWAK